MAELRADALWCRYARRAPWALRDVACSLCAGVTAIVGPNASGKSTLLRAMLGALRPARGVVTLDGTPIGRLPTRERARKIAYVAQRPDVSAAFAVREVVALGRFASNAGARADREATERAMTRLDVASLADRRFHALSVGQQQRVALARAAAQLDAGDAAGPRVLLADEPCSGMDPRHELDAMGLLAELAAGGVAVGVVLHDLTLATRFADRAVVLADGGTVAAAGPASDVLEPGTLGRVFGVEMIGSDTPAGHILTAVPPRR